MKTPEEIINSFKTPHIADLGVDWIISKNKLETLIKINQKDAYNQAIDDAVKNILTRSFKDGNTEYYIKDKQSILNLKK